MPETKENRTNERLNPVYQTRECLKGLCNIGMEAMRLTYFNYNIIANNETKLHFRCIAMRIMTKIKDNYKQPPLCNHSKPRLDIIQAGFVF